MKKKVLFSILLAGLFIFSGCAGESAASPFVPSVSDKKISQAQTATTAGDSADVKKTEYAYNPDGGKIAHYEYNQFLTDLANFPLSFTYGSTKYDGFGKDFNLDRKTETDKDGKITTDLLLSHVSGDFEVRVSAALWKDYGAYEWTVWMENIKNTNTQQFSNINALDGSFAGTNPVLKGLLGDQRPNYYPYEYNLMKTDVHFQSTTGRATEEYMPYMNLETDSGGAMLAIGWPGDWKVNFNYENKHTHVTAGQAELDTYLKPGESFRTPLIAVVRYAERDEDIATNLWRQWYIDCNMPKKGSEEIAPATTLGTNQYTSEMVTATESNQLTAMETWKKNGIKADYWWMDAGWYTRPGGESITGWMETGTWDIDYTRFPTGLKAISEYGDTIGTDTILWFEPEAIRFEMGAMAEYENCSMDWGLKNDGFGGGYLADMANSGYRSWLLTRVIKVLEQGEIDIYREDFNVTPAPVWKLKNEEKRIGLYENEYCVGHLAYWDALLEHFPNLVIDSCASGGNRNDLETMRRAIPIHKTDYAYTLNTYKQSMHHSLFKWIPYFGSQSTAVETCRLEPQLYDIRSSFASMLNLGYYYEQTQTGYDTIYKGIKEWRSVNEYLNDDYYPLTPFTRDGNDWIGWEFFDESKQSGFMQLFRPLNGGEEYVVQLRGLEPNKTYKVTDFDGNLSFELTGSQLAEGIVIRLANPESNYTAKIEEVKS